MPIINAKNTSTNECSFLSILINNKLSKYSEDFQIALLEEILLKYKQQVNAVKY